MSIEAIVLTGGASTRMGRDKATFPIAGVPLGELIVNFLVSHGLSVTVLGRTPISGAHFIQDSEDFAGPLVAIAAFQPSCDLVFIASCDLASFDPSVVDLLCAELGEHQAAVPVVDEKLQPLCALYRAEAFDLIPGVLKDPRKSMMAWLNRLSVKEVAENRLSDVGIATQAVRGANTPAEFEQLASASGVFTDPRRTPELGC